MSQNLTYEIRYLMAAPALLWLYWQYAFVYWCIRSAPDAVTWLLVPLWVPMGAAFIVQNILFNLTFGSFIFWERPRQWYFSDRIRAADEQRKRRYRVLLNAWDEGHIK